MLPALLFLVLDAHLQGHDVDARHLDFTCDALELLTAMDAMDVGLNWACARPLSQQRNVLVGDLRRHACRDARVLNINRTLCVGTNVAIEHLGGTAQGVLSIDVAAVHDVQAVRRLVLSLQCQLREQYGGTQVCDRRRYTLAQLELSGRVLY